MISSRRDAFDDRPAAGTDRVCMRECSAAGATASTRTAKLRTKVGVDSSTRRSAYFARTDATSTAAGGTRTRRTRTIGNRDRSTCPTTAAAGFDPAPGRQ
jgi:hypothetical protein